MSEEEYRKIQKVYCPYFRDYVHFTDVGFEHLRFKNKFTPRPNKDREVRFRIMSKGVFILSNSHTLQGKTFTRKMEERFVNTRKEIALCGVTYYEFIAIVDGFRIKVVLKQIENGKIEFLSVIPAYKQKTPSEDDDSL